MATHGRAAVAGHRRRKAGQSPHIATVRETSTAERFVHRRGIERLVGVCVLLSAGVHGLITPEHFQEWWGYGVFFAVATVAMLVLGLALLTDAIDPRYFPGDVIRFRRLVYMSGLVGVVLLVAMYAVSRTVGVPLGPGAGLVEAVGGLDIVAKVAELGAAVGLAILITRSSHDSHRSRGRLDG